MKTDYAIFRRNLSRIRAAKGISARELSDTCKLKQMKRIHDIEEGRGQPSLDEVCIICKELGFGLDQMLYSEATTTVTFNKPT